jgi:hypothetical protein
VFICCVLGKHVAVGSALEGLKAGLALDGKGGHVLPKVRGSLDYSRYGGIYGFQLALCDACAWFRGVALALLLCSAKLSASDTSLMETTAYLFPLPMANSCCLRVEDCVWSFVCKGCLCRSGGVRYLSVRVSGNRRKLWVNLFWPGLASAGSHFHIQLHS